MGYAEFEAKKALQHTPMISILKQGVLSINQSCYEQYFKKSKYAKFYYDEKNRKMGIKPTEVKEKAYPVRQISNGKVFNLTAIAFLKHYNIPHTESRAYNCHWNSKENLIEIDLKGA